MLESFSKKRWEGKSLAFKLRYMYANYTGITFGVFLFLFGPLVIGSYRLYNFEGSRLDAIRKYKVDYTVVRDDDPRVNELIAQKEAGRHHFPKY